MPAQIYPSRIRRSQGGVTLIEALVALMVMSFGMVALVGLLSNLRSSGDIAKQRSEAMRLAQAELGSLRSFSVLKRDVGSTTPQDYDNDVVTPTVSPSRSGANDNTTFVIARTVTPLVKGAIEPQARTVSVNVSWSDRAGAGDSVTLNTVISRTDPAFSAALSVTPSVNGVRLSDGRNPVIPASAKDLGNGSSAFIPSVGGKTAWVLNNVTGVITGKCEVEANTVVTTLTASSVESCKNNTVGYLVSGTIRFSSTSPANPSAPEASARALSVYLSLTPSQFTVSQGGHDVLAPGGAYPISPSFECFNDSPTSTELTRTFINYNCIVYPNTQTPPNWWGKVLINERDLDIGTTATQFRVCRYSADYNGNGRIDNEEHPASYSGVSYSLARQNFLVVRGDVSCPTAPAVDPANGVFVDYSTVQIQPS